MNKKQVDDLLKNGFFREEALKGKLIETHISWIILTKEHAFKIKKPIQYSFLDFTTLERREYFCQRELKLNKPLAGDMYQDVIQVKQFKGQLIIGGEKGKTIDHALLMKRMQNSKEMDVMLKKRRVVEGDLHALAEKIAEYHINAEIINVRPDLKEMKADFNDLLTIKDFITENLGKRYTNIIIGAVTTNNNFIKNQGKLIKQRAENGFVRYCHGDFHSRNIFLYKEPVIFDCIEFNDHFKQIDVLNEIAFFCMDLEAFKRDDLSRVFLSEYLKFFPCVKTEGDRKLFIYYKFYRANIRAKVNALKAAQAKNDTDKISILKEVKKYLELMAKYKEELGEVL